MKFTDLQKAAALEHADRLMQGTVRGMMLKGERRVKAVNIIMDSIALEMGYYSEDGVRTESAPMRQMMVCSVRKRIRENPECESILILLILGAIFTWLIQRLLDWIFLNGQYPE